MTTIAEKVARTFGFGKAAAGRADPSDYPDEPPEVASKLACYDTYRYELSSFRDRAKDLHKSSQSSIKDMNEFQQAAMNITQDKKTQDLDVAIRSFAELVRARENHDRKLNDSLYRLLVEPLNVLLDKDLQSIENMRNRYIAARTDFNKVNSQAEDVRDKSTAERQRTVEPDLQIASRNFEQAKIDLVQKIDLFEKQVQQLFQNNLKQFMNTENEFCQSCNHLVQSLSSRMSDVSLQQPASSDIASSDIASSEFSAQPQQQPVSGFQAAGMVAGSGISKDIPISSSQSTGYSGQSSGLSSGYSGLHHHSGMQQPSGSMQQPSSQFSSTQPDVQSSSLRSGAGVTHYGAQTGAAKSSEIGGLKSDVSGLKSDVSGLKSDVRDVSRGESVDKRNA